MRLNRSVLVLLLLLAAAGSVSRSDSILAGQEGGRPLVEDQVRISTRGSIMQATKRARRSSALFFYRWVLKKRLTATTIAALG